MRNVSIGLRELKQNPSDVISRVEQGAQFDVLRNGKPTNVVIQLRRPPKLRWVSREMLTQTLATVLPDQTGWLELNDAHRDNDPIVDPWSNGQ